MHEVRAGLAELREVGDHGLVRLDDVTPAAAERAAALVLGRRTGDGQVGADAAERVERLLLRGVEPARQGGDRNHETDADRQPEQGQDRPASSSEQLGAEIADVEHGLIKPPSPKTELRLRIAGMPQIGKAGAAVTHISQAYPDRVEVRGRDLAGDLMGRLSFTEYFHLLLTGREPTEDQRFFLDLLLVAIAEHGMMPTNVAARMTLAADPGSLQGAVAAGILGAGPVVLGTSEACARLLEERRASGREPHESSRRFARPTARSRASGIRFTSRSTRAPSGFSSWRTSAG